MNWKKRNYCGELNRSHEGKEVLLMGWVDANRDHGSLLFIHLRDIKGIVQVVFDPKLSSECYRNANVLKEEYVVTVFGRVAIRKKGTENPYLETGNLEVFATEMEILSESKVLPFQISEKAMVLGEEISTSPENVDEELEVGSRA